MFCCLFVMNGQTAEYDITSQVSDLGITLHYIHPESIVIQYYSTSCSKYIRWNNVQFLALKLKLRIAFLYRPIWGFLITIYDDHF